MNTLYHQRISMVINGNKKSLAVTIGLAKAYDNILQNTPQ